MLVSEHLHAERSKSQMGRELDRGYGSWNQREVRTEKEKTFTVRAEAGRSPMERGVGAAMRHPNYYRSSRPELDFRS